MTTRAPCFCDLFCGGGGSALGFVAAGWRHLGGIDIDDKACWTYSRNVSPRVLNEDITSVHPLDFLEFLGKRPDIVLASPPCEGFSEANEQRAFDFHERLYTHPGALTITAIDWICDLEPRRGFIIENVPAMGHPVIKDMLQEELARIGYDDVYFNIIRAEKFGSASRRPRIFLSNLDLDERAIEEALGVDQPERTAGEAIGDLPHPSDVHDIPNHEIIPHESKRIRSLAKLGLGQHLVKFKGAGGRKKGTWTRLDPREPAPIVMGKSKFVHPFEARELTVREYARLQGFPDHHVFEGPLGEQKNQVGEAVSPLVSNAIARYLIATSPLSRHERRRNSCNGQKD